MNMMLKDGNNLSKQMNPGLLNQLTNMKMELDEKL